MSGHSQLMVKLTLAERRLEAVESENKVSIGVSGCSKRVIFRTLTQLLS